MARLAGNTLRQRRRRVRLVWALTVLAVACGGSSTPTTAPPAAPPTTGPPPTASPTAPPPTTAATAGDCAQPGFRRHAGDGFSLCLWEHLTPESPDNVQITSLLEASLEGDAQEIEEIETTFQDSLVFAAFDRASPTFVDNFFLLQQPAFAVELASIADIVRGQVGQLGAEGIETELAALEFGGTLIDTLIVSYRIPVSDALGTIYVFQTDRAQWVMALNAGNLGGYEGGLAPVVESFEETG